MPFLGAIKVWVAPGKLHQTRDIFQLTCRSVSVVFVLGIDALGKLKFMKGAHRLTKAVGNRLAMRSISELCPEDVILLG